MVSGNGTPLEVFTSVCDDFYATARAAAASGRKVAGFVCSYAPQELLHAAGYLPVRVLGRPGGTPRADQLLQAYACSLARSSFDAALSGEFDFMDMVVFSHTCDTMQNLADLWRSSRPNQEVVIICAPTVTSGNAAHSYYRKVLDDVRKQIEALSGPISDEAIRASIELYARHRRLIQKLYDLRREHSELISGRELLAVVTSSMLMDKEEHLRLLEPFVAGLKAQCGTGAPACQASTAEGGCPTSDGSTAGGGCPTKKLPRVFVAGSVCQNMGFITALEEAGCMVVDDDLCMGGRSFSLPEAPAGNPMDALVEMYLGRRPCPAFHTPGFDPGAFLVERAQAARAAGVVFLLTKFCDPWFFDYPHVNKSLETAGIPGLLVEVEQNLPVPEQFRTRAEAFVELLKARTA